MVTMTLTEFNQRRSAALRYADTEDVLIQREGVPAYRLTRIVAPPRTLAAEIEAGRATPPRQNGLPMRERRVWNAGIDMVSAAIAEREAGR